MISDKPYLMQWPTDGTCLPLEDLHAPLRRVFRQMFLFRRKPRVDVDWSGPPLLEEFVANGPDPHSQPLAENLIYSEDDQGRDGLDEFISLALRIGMTQGAKWRQTSARPKARRLRLMAAILLAARMEGDAEDKAYVIQTLQDVIDNAVG